MRVAKPRRNFRIAAVGELKRLMECGPNKFIHNYTFSCAFFIFIAFVFHRNNLFLSLLRNAPTIHKLEKYWHMAENNILCAIGFLYLHYKGCVFLAV